MTLSQKIKTFRKKRGLTLKALAESAGTSLTYIWELENDDKIKPSGELLKRIADGLGVTVDFLLSPELDEPHKDDEALVVGRQAMMLSPNSRESLIINIKFYKNIDKINKVKHDG